MKKYLIVAICLLCALPALAQQPQTHTAPTVLENAKWANGVAPGYAPTAGSGLTLNISAGTAFCGGSVIAYAGGTLSMTASATNNVYLNTAASCVPAAKTTAFTASDIPIAVVTATSSITAISDLRTMFIQQSGAGGGVSVGLALPNNIFSVSGSPVTGIGTLTGTFNSQLPGYVLQSPPTTTQLANLAQATNTCSAVSAGSTFSCTFNSAVAAGDELIAFGCFGGANPFNSSSGVTDAQGDVFTPRLYNFGAGDDCYVYTAPNAVGGSTTLTFNAAGALGNGGMMVLDYSGIKSSSEFDVQAGGGGSITGGCNVGNLLKFPSITTTNAADVIIAFAFDVNRSTATFGVGDGYRLDGPAAAGNGVTFGVSSANQATVVTEKPFMTADSTSCNAGDGFAVAEIALKLSTSANPNAIVAAPMSISTLNNGGLFIPTISYNATTAGQTAAIADTTMVTAPATQLYQFVGEINCTTSSASATATLNLKWTDSSNTAQTQSFLSTCTTLGASSVNQTVYPVRAKSGTAITWGVTIANTPTYDVDVRLLCFNGSTC